MDLWVVGILHNTTRHQNPEVGGIMDLWNVGILPQHYTASQPSLQRRENLKFHVSSLRHLFQTGTGVHPTSNPMGTRGSLGQSGRGVKLTTHLHLVQSLRMHGAISPLSQWVFMAWCLMKQRIHIHGAVFKHRYTFSLPLPGRKETNEGCGPHYKSPYPCRPC